MTRTAAQAQSDLYTGNRSQHTATHCNTLTHTATQVRSGLYRSTSATILRAVCLSGRQLSTYDRMTQLSTYDHLKMALKDHEIMNEGLALHTIAAMTSAITGVSQCVAVCCAPHHHGHEPCHHRQKFSKVSFTVMMYRKSSSRLTVKKSNPMDLERDLFVVATVWQMHRIPYLYRSFSAEEPYN